MGQPFLVFLILMITINLAVLLKSILNAIITKIKAKFAKKKQTPEEDALIKKTQVQNREADLEGENNGVSAKRKKRKVIVKRKKTKHVKANQLHELSMKEDQLVSVDEELRIQEL